MNPSKQKQISNEVLYEETIRNRDRMDTIHTAIIEKMDDFNNSLFSIKESISLDKKELASLKETTESHAKQLSTITDFIKKIKNSFTIGGLVIGAFTAVIIWGAKNFIENNNKETTKTITADVSEKLNKDLTDKIPEEINKALSKYDFYTE